MKYSVLSHTGLNSCVVHIFWHLDIGSAQIISNNANLSWLNMISVAELNIATTFPLLKNLFSIL